MPCDESFTLDDESELGTNYPFQYVDRKRRGIYLMACCLPTLTSAQAANHLRALSSRPHCCIRRLRAGAPEDDKNMVYCWRVLLAGQGQDKERLEPEQARPKLTRYRLFSVNVILHLGWLATTDSVHQLLHMRMSAFKGLYDDPVVTLACAESWPKEAHARVKMARVSRTKEWLPVL